MFLLPVEQKEKKTNSEMRKVSHEEEKRKLRDEKRKSMGQEELYITLALPRPPSSLLQVGSLRRLDSSWPWDLDQITGGRPCCIVRSDVERHRVPERALHPRGREVLVHTTSCTTFMDSKNLSATVSMNWVTPASSISESASRRAASGWCKRAPFISGLRRYVL